MTASKHILFSLDGHHKVIPWRLITHGDIDGFTRMIVYLNCSSNNRSSTVVTKVLLTLL